MLLAHVAFMFAACCMSHLIARCTAAGVGARHGSVRAVCCARDARRCKQRRREHCCRSASPYPSPLQHVATQRNMFQHSATCCNMVQHAATQRGHVCNPAAYVAVYIAGVELGRATLRSTRSKARCGRARVRACMRMHACVRVGAVVFACAAACCAGRAAVANIRCYRRASCTQTARSHSMTSVALYHS